MEPTESCELPTPRTWCGSCWRTRTLPYHLWVEDFSFIVFLINNTHSPVCITIPTKADVMMYIDCIKRIIIDEFYISVISRVFILIVIYSELLSWSSQLFENIVEFCWYWSFVTNVPVSSSIACADIPHNIYCLIDLAMDSLYASQHTMTAPNAVQRRVPPQLLQLKAFPHPHPPGVGLHYSHFPRIIRYPIKFGKLKIISYLCTR